MKRTDILPSIYESSLNPTKTEGNINQRFNTHRFALMMRKFQLKKLAPITNKSLSSNRYQTDPNELQEMDEEDKKANIEDEKSIIKIYESNESEIIQKIKDEILNSIPYTIDNKYGFVSFKIQII